MRQQLSRGRAHEHKSADHRCEHVWRRDIRKTNKYAFAPLIENIRFVYPGKFREFFIVALTKYNHTLNPGCVFGLALFECCGFFLGSFLFLRSERNDRSPLGYKFLLHGKKFGAAAAPRGNAVALHRRPQRALCIGRQLSYFGNAAFP